MFRQVVDTGNQSFRDAWVEETLSRIGQASRGLNLLDVGAGQSPYRDMIVDLGFSYKSHDFSSYVPSRSQPGMQSPQWEYPPHDFTCDIVELPPEAAADVLLCTEVLEHVPDPVRAFGVMAELTLPGGFLIVTVPFLSLMHQAPFWYQSGLSPFWFEYWAPRASVSVETLIVQGDYIDLMAQESSRLLNFTPPIPGLDRLGMWAVRRLRRRLSQDVLQAGALGTLFVGRKMTQPDPRSEVLTR